MKKLLNRICLFLEGFLLINLIWYIGYLAANTTVIPNPITVYQNFGTVLADDILIHILCSLERIGLGLGLSLLIGIPVGILMAYSNNADKILYPLVYFSYPIPKTALLPIAMLLWGMRGRLKDCHYLSDYRISGDCCGSRQRTEYRFFALSGNSQRRSF